MDKINNKILQNNWSQKPFKKNEPQNLYDGPKVYTQHATDSMQSLLGYNYFSGGEWDKRNATTYHVAILFGKMLIMDQVTVECEWDIVLFCWMFFIGVDVDSIVFYWC